MAKQSKEKLNATCPVELITAIAAERPKRDASARASAMLMQTLEFEKVRHAIRPVVKRDEEPEKEVSARAAKEAARGEAESKRKSVEVSPAAQKKYELLRLGFRL